ncbi:unnamed protein product [Candidula unifasciata]|uniref:Sperm-associated antigen 16 protein n=1 Tax=Candidula unifasciata TaxID=100452 RepID=A0A8S3Z8C8_9EUPU|nr:unnamed protein product [Candidula unifasciata]
MAVNLDNDRFYVEKVEVPVDSDDEFQYEEVLVDEEIVSPELDEDLDAAVRTIREANEEAEARVLRETVTRPTIVQKPEVVDDFVRNFLVKMGLMKTLDCFQTEWYELQERGFLRQDMIGTVPDVYTQNLELENEIVFLKNEAMKFRNAAAEAKDIYAKLRKQRDFHRMHHNRVVQEKNKLIDDIKRLKKHYAQYAPNMEALKVRYEAAIKEKMLASLERDRALNQLHELQDSVKHLEISKDEPKRMVEEKAKGPTHKQLLQERQKQVPEADNMEMQILPGFKRFVNDSDFPIDNGINPDLNPDKCSANRTGGFHLANTITAHSHAISGIALHPNKQILATCSDDQTWKMWAVPSGEIIMTGEGHTDWVSDCSFHPSGSTLATTSGDSTVKIWDFSKAACVHTFIDHGAVVWTCSWHSCGDFLATSSMDNTAKVWDINSLRCRYTLRGHVDSVNSIEFLPYSNTLLSCSADKTVSLWDARMAICAQTFFGHMYSVNHATFNMKGDMIASCDSFGVVKLWDVRSVAPMASFETGPHPANKMRFDPSGSVLAVASSDSTIKMYDIESAQIYSLLGHEDAVQCLCFHRGGEYLISGGSDSTVRIWC